MCPHDSLSTADLAIVVRVAYTLPREDLATRTQREIERTARRGASSSIFTCEFAADKLQVAASVKEDPPVRPLLSAV